MPVETPINFLAACACCLRHTRVRGIRRCGSVAPIAPRPEYRYLDVLQQQIYSYVQNQVMLTAHQNPVMETMNLPYRRRQ